MWFKTLPDMLVAIREYSTHAQIEEQNEREPAPWSWGSSSEADSHPSDKKVPRLYTTRKSITALKISLKLVAVLNQTGAVTFCLLFL
jgi:hypothetical protein